MDKYKVLHGTSCGSMGDMESAIESLEGSVLNALRDGYRLHGSVQSHTETSGSDHRFHTHHLFQVVILDDIESTN